MDIKKDNQVTYDEARYINRVSEEFLTEGKIISKCPRCGGNLVYEDYGSGHIIRCEKENCIKIAYRGL